MFVACNKKSSNESDISYNRETISLNGFWQIEDCISDTVIPQAFHHTVPVPGLVNLATPSFKDAGRFISREVANHPLYKILICHPKQKPLLLAYPFRKGITSGTEGLSWHRIKRKLPY